MKSIAQALFILFIFAFTMLLILAWPEKLKSDYHCRIVVDKYEKIPQAMTNAVSDVTSRNFIVISVDVERYPLAKTYSITCRGITIARLLKTSD